MWCCGNLSEYQKLLYDFYLRALNSIQECCSNWRTTNKREKNLKSSNNKWPCHIKKEKLLLKTLKGDSPCDFPSTARKKKKTINHSSWHKGAEQRILEFERLWNCHVGKFLCDLVLEDKKFMWSLGFRALSRLLRNRLVYWVELECFLTNDGNVFGNVLSVGICQC